MKTLKIKEIFFNSISNDVVCYGSYFTGKLSIESSVTVCHSTLNRIINKIAIQSPNNDVWQWLETHENGEETFYHILLPEEQQLCVSLLDFKSWFNDVPRKICA